MSQAPADTAKPVLAAQPVIDQIQAAGWTQTIFLDRDCAGIYRPTAEQVAAILPHVADGTRIARSNALLWFYPPGSTVAYGEAGRLGAHTADCLRATAQSDAWFVAHPAACRACRGRGTTPPTYDSSTGVTDCDPCAGCTERGRCPRCGTYDFDWEQGDREIGGSDGACLACTWTGEQDGDMDPAVDWECWCGYHEQELEDERAAEAARQHWEQQSAVDLLDADYFRRDDEAYDAERDRAASYRHGRLRSRF